MSDSDGYNEMLREAARWRKEKDLCESREREALEVLLIASARFSVGDSIEGNGKATGYSSLNGEVKLKIVGRAILFTLPNLVEISYSVLPYKKNGGIGTRVLTIWEHQGNWRKV